MPQFNIGGLVLGRNPLIKSIQYGTISISSTSNTATITSVDTNNSIVLHYGQTCTGDQVHSTMVRLSLSNSTTVTGVRAFDTGVATVSFGIIEFYSGLIKSNQSGTINIATGTSNTASINAVDTSKTMLLCLGESIQYYPDDANMCSYLVLTNSTTITATRSKSTPYDTIAGYQVAEFY